MARGLDFPILLDPDQLLARQVNARVSPEAFLLASDGQVLYRGRIDDLFAPDGSADRAHGRTSSKMRSRQHSATNRRP